MNLAELDAAGCLVSLANGADGQVLQMVNGVPTWITLAITCEDIQDCVGGGMSLATGLTYTDATGTFSVAEAADGGITNSATGLRILINPDPCNIAITAATGLMVPEQCDIATATTGEIFNGTRQAYAAAQPAGTVVPNSTTTLSLTNPSTCNPALAVIAVGWYSFHSRDNAVLADIQANLDLREVAPTARRLGYVGTNFSDTADTAGLDTYMIATAIEAVAAGATLTFTVRIEQESTGSVSMLGGAIGRIDIVLIAAP